MLPLALILVLTPSLLSAMPANNSIPALILSIDHPSLLDDIKAPVSGSNTKNQNILKNNSNNNSYVNNADTDADPEFIQGIIDMADNLTRTELDTIVDEIIQSGRVNLVAPGDFGQTPIFLAPHLEDPTIVPRLVAAGADVNHRDSYGFTALDITVINGYPTVAASLLEAGADPRARDADGRSVVFRLMLNNLDTSVKGVEAKKEILRLLVRNGADINQKDNKGMTPLISLVYIDCANKSDSFRADVTEVRMLLEAGADPSIEDRAGNTARDYAVQANLNCQVNYSDEILGLL